MKLYKRLILVLISLILWGGWQVASASPTDLTLTVNRTTDGSDLNLGDGQCDASVNTGEQCTLRAAIEELNAQGPGTSSHRIEFNISGTGPFTIAPDSALPAVQVPVKIDGATQPGTICPTEDTPANLMIVLDGINAGVNADGLIFPIGSESSRVSGLVIGNFDKGIEFISDIHSVNCSHLGVGPDGVTPMPNNTGVYLVGNRNLIGGPWTPDERNVISGNNRGVVIHNASDVNGIINNLIGTTADGMSALGNDTGVLMYGPNTVVYDNVISGNDDGIVIEDDENTIRTNLIGLARDGATPLPNTGHGIVLQSNAEKNSIGLPDSGNQIAFNGGDGVRIEGEDSTRNQLIQNRIYSNGGLGIDLEGDGVTSNDSGDTDSGANWLQNYPILSAAPGGSIIEVSLDSHPYAPYTVEVFSNEGCDPTGYGEGQQYLDTAKVTTDGSGQAIFEIDLTGMVFTGDGVTVTAIDPYGNTSEFSNCVTVSPVVGDVLTVNRTGDGGDLNPGDGLCDVSVNVGEQCSLRAAIEELNARGPGVAPHRIEFDISGTGPFTITPASALPDVIVPMEIDGATQPGASCPAGDSPANLMIVLDGSSAGIDASGLTLGTGSDGSAIRGLVIGNFDNSGIVAQSEDNKVLCNHLGLGVDGFSTMGNNHAGVQIIGSGNTVGGENFASWRNVISGNQNGVILQNAGEQNYLVGNYIGATADGMSAIGNNTGVLVYGDEKWVIKNIVSGNGAGIVVEGSGNFVSGNLVGLARDEDTPLPNTSHGILLQGFATENTVGSIGFLNQIAFNGGDGVRIEGADTSKNIIILNAIYANDGLGIDLEGDGVTSNDPGDTDSGANQRQNYPILSATPGSFIVDAALDSYSNTTYLVGIYRNQSCDSSGHGEGQQFLDMADITTDGSGQAVFKIDLTGMVSTGNGITVTATDPEGNTSEFSNCVTVSPVTGNILTVNQTSDDNDLNPGDSLCDTSGDAGEQCSLRAAIEELNAQGPGVAPHRIEFDIGGAGPFTITPASALPEIIVPVEIDGVTQSGASCPTNDSPANLMIILDGSSAGNDVSGLTLGTGSDGSAIRGLVIGNFDQSGIVAQSDDNRVLCNHLGLGADGFSDTGNADTGIQILGSGNTIGGANFASRRNVISGNDTFGVYIGSGADENFLGNNFVGTTADGLEAVGNHSGGIYLGGDNNRIGGPQEEFARNVIGGNHDNGITISSGEGNLIQGNIIGMTRDGHSSLPNTGHGIEILGDAAANQIGHVLPYPSELLYRYGNLIAHNGGHGIVIKANEGIYPTGNMIGQNAIYDNAGLGIDLGDDGVDANDSGDSDIGPNLHQNYPVLTTIGDSPVVTVTLESQSSMLYIIDFYRSTSCDPSGYGEGQQYLNTGDVQIDGSGKVSFSVNLAGLVSSEDHITATATDPEGNTSEFSNCVTLITPETGYAVFLPLIWR